MLQDAVRLPFRGIMPEVRKGMDKYLQDTVGQFCVIWARTHRPSLSNSRRALSTRPRRAKYSPLSGTSVPVVAVPRPDDN